MKYGKMTESEVEARLTDLSTNIAELFGCVSRHTERLNMLSEDIKELKGIVYNLEREVSRVCAELHLVREMYNGKLRDLKDRINDTGEFADELWSELSIVQQQTRENKVKAHIAYGLTAGIVASVIATIISLVIKFVLY